RGVRAMKAKLFAALACLASFASSPTIASTVVWQLENVTFGDGGTATGSFSGDNVSHTFLGWDFFVAGGNVATFTPMEYNPAPSIFFNDQAGTPDDPHYTLPLPSTFRFIVHTPDTPLPDTRRDLRIAFTDLPDAGGVVALNLLDELGVECFNCGPFRLITGG